MRHTITSTGGFAAGVLVGIGAAAVAGLVIGAVRRGRDMRAEHPHLIDGVNPPDEVELAATPAPEGNAIPGRLESDAFDIPIESQRW